MANGGSPSGLDDGLYDSFSNYLDKNVSITEFGRLQAGKYEQISRTNWNKIPNKYPNIYVDIINNALTTTTNGRDRIVNKLVSEYPKFNITCPITSILDSQGSFGSCTGGRLALTNPKNLDISIETEGTDSETEFAFTMELIYKNTGKTILTYTLQSGDFVLTPEINVDIGKKTLNILSASNSFSSTLREIENNLSQYPNGQSINMDDALQNDSLIKSLMSALSRKFMGDFSQELNSITKAGKMSVNHQLLCNGDRPSFIRASLLTLLANEGINDNAAVLYMSDKGGYLIKKNGKFTNRGGAKTKKRRKISRKKKGHAKTNKRRTIRKNRKK